MIGWYGFDKSINSLLLADVVKKKKKVLTSTIFRKKCFTVGTVYYIRERWVLSKKWKLVVELESDIVSQW